MSSAELAREREYVGALYARLDELRDEAELQLDAVRRRSRGTHQNRSERDAFARIYEDRISQLAQDRRAARVRSADPRDRRRRPDAAIRCTATSAASACATTTCSRCCSTGGCRRRARSTRRPRRHPLGARARRHLTSQGREIVRIDDEIFDARAARRRRVRRCRARRRCMATLTAQRTGRMGDIVATIQAEQDRDHPLRAARHARRAGRPGHRQDRRRAAPRRLPALLAPRAARVSRCAHRRAIAGRSCSTSRPCCRRCGETGVVLSSVGQLYPGVDAALDDAPEVAALKGSLEMADAASRAPCGRARWCRAEPQMVDVNGERLDDRARSSSARRCSGRGRPRKPHNVGARHVQQGGPVGDRPAAGRAAASARQHDRRERPGVAARGPAHRRTTSRSRSTRRGCRSRPQKLLQDLYARPQWLASLTPRWSAGRARPAAPRPGRRRSPSSDVPLLDEAAELLGEHDATSDAAASASARRSASATSRTPSRRSATWASRASSTPRTSPTGSPSGRARHHRRARRGRPHLDLRPHRRRRGAGALADAVAGAAATQPAQVVHDRRRRRAGQSAAAGTTSWDDALAPVRRRPAGASRSSPSTTARPPRSPRSPRRWPWRTGCGSRARARCATSEWPVDVVRRCGCRIRGRRRRPRRPCAPPPTATRGHARRDRAGALLDPTWTPALERAFGTEVGRGAARAHAARSRC